MRGHRGRGDLLARLDLRVQLAVPVLKELPDLRVQQDQQDPRVKQVQQVHQVLMDSGHMAPVECDGDGVCLKRSGPLVHSSPARTGQLSARLRMGRRARPDDDEAAQSVSGTAA